VAFQNQALDSADCGGFRFLAVGPTCTLKTAPERFPDTSDLGVGWRYLFVGWLDLETGKIVEEANVKDVEDRLRKG
jgi:hypothetical protein